MFMRVARCGIICRVCLQLVYLSVQNACSTDYSSSLSAIPNTLLLSLVSSLVETTVFCLWICLQKSLEAISGEQGLEVDGYLGSETFRALLADCREILDLRNINAGSITEKELCKLITKTISAKTLN